MKVKMLLVAAALLAIASLGMAQTYPVYISWYADMFALTKNCDGTGGPIPEGTTIWIHQDRDGDGAELSDPLAELCDLPPSCPTGPVGTMNDNTMTMNGLYWGMDEGMFMTDYAVSQLAQPNYLRFFIVVNYTESTVLPSLDTLIHTTHWVSGVTVTSSGQTYDVDCNESSFWTCTEETVTHPYVNPCTPDLITYFDPRPYPGHGPYNFSDCAVVCPDQAMHTVCVGPVAAMNRIPRGFVFPGCEPVVHPETPVHCDSICEPATNWVFGAIAGWRYVELPAGSGLFYYCADILPLMGATEGCICIVVDFILPVEMGEVSILPLNNAVNVSWKTLSETDLSGFAIYRDNARIATKEAANSPTGAEYSYVDNTVENGHTYTYELRTVDVNDNETTVATESVTPSFEHAVVTEYALHQNYPNPFNPSTKITFDVVENNAVTLTIYNATGQLVGTLVNGAQYTNGRHSITFDAGNLTSGLYFYTVKIGNEFTATKKMLLVK